MIDNTCTRKFLASAALAVLIFVTWGMGRASAGETLLGLDTNTYYDIYIGGENDLSIIKSVVIVGTREFNGMTFLVVQASSFAGSRAEGLVLLENVRAILPTNKITNAPVYQKIPYHK